VYGARQSSRFHFTYTHSIAVRSTWSLRHAVSGHGSGEVVAESEFVASVECLRASSDIAFRTYQEIRQLREGIKVRALGSLTVLTTLAAAQLFRMDVATQGYLGLLGLVPIAIGAVLTLPPILGGATTVPADLVQLAEGVLKPTRPVTESDVYRASLVATAEAAEALKKANKSWSRFLAGSLYMTVIGVSVLTALALLRDILVPIWAAAVGGLVGLVLVACGELLTGSGGLLPIPRGAGRRAT